MTAQFFLDTNIVAYAASSRNEDGAKTAISRQLLGADSVAVSAQVLQEFFVVVTRKFKPPLSVADAEVYLDALERMPIASLTPELIRRAIRLQERHQISYWDAAILSAAKELAATTVFSEDLNNGQTYDGVTVINPFLPNVTLPT
ncbi:MAG: PIN domain-containing protein [Lacunisphaera sp.]|nr:PIN domain-containing protein [Lacunisphaera sp.]